MSDRRVGSLETGNGRNAASPAGPRVPADSRRKDWRTPLLLTLSVHLMVFTLAINHRLFALFEQPAPGPYVVNVSELNGVEESEVQENDPGAAPGDESELTNPVNTASVSEAFEALATAEVQPLPDRTEPTTEVTDAEAPKPSEQSLSERLQASVDASGGGGESGETMAVPGGGSHGLRGEGRHGIGLNRHGGSGETEDAVHMGLAWLARVQDTDGRWDSDGFMKHYLGDASYHDQLQEGVGLARNDIGLTGLCMLAFTGAGYSDKTGKYKEAVGRARGYLLQNQRVIDGGFGLQDAGRRITNYGHALATFALTDLYLLTGDERLRVPMTRALEYLLSVQGPGGGWDYDQRYPDARDDWRPGERNDLSITGWVVLALVAAREANFEVPRDNLRRLAGYLKECTRADGSAEYANVGVRRGQRGLAMMGASNVSRRLLGEPGDSLIQQKQLERMADYPPDWDDSRNIFGSNLYYWYYGSIAMLLSKEDNGHERWREWNIALKKTLLDNQVKSGARRGSFDPVSHWARNGGGRVYSTALGVLNLEIYYRYEPEYLRVRATELSWLWAEE